MTGVLGSAAAIAGLRSQRLSPHRKALSHTPARLVVPNQGPIFGPRGFIIVQRLPDRQHAFGSRHSHVVVERGQCMDTLDRMAHRRIDEYENATEHLARKREGFCGDDHRLAELVARDALRLVVRNEQCLRQAGNEMLGLAGEYCRFKLLADQRIGGGAAAIGAGRGDDVEIEQDQLSLVRTGRKEQLVEFGGGGRIDGARCGRWL
jgi:hypothetical protein